VDQIISACITAAVSVISVFVAHALLGSRWRKEREEKQWAEALAMARVAEAPEESEIARAIARHRLAQLGIGTDWIAEARHVHKRAAFDLFKAPGLSPAELDTVERAIASPEPALDQDIVKVIDIATWIDHAFHVAGSEARAEEDTRVRIFVLIALFSFIFICLAFAAVARSLGL
jgi:hypothetical protein